VKRIKKQSLVIGLLLVMSAIICFNVNPVSAQTQGVPYVELIEFSTSGTDTILNITVRMITGTGEYNPLNFIDHINLEINGEFPYIMVNTADIQLIHFSVQYNMGELTEPCTVRAQPINLQNMGEWSEPISIPAIPEFSLIQLAPILMVTSIAILLIKSKITTKSKK